MMVTDVINHHGLNFWNLCQKLTKYNSRISAIQCFCWRTNLSINACLGFLKLAYSTHFLVKKFQNAVTSHMHKFFFWFQVLNSAYCTWYCKTYHHLALWLSYKNDHNDVIWFGSDLASKNLPIMSVMV